jgi:hypothetical protein
MGIFSRIFGPGVDYAQLVKNGAIILDVRTPGEYAGGHIKGSKNIPLQSLKIYQKTKQSSPVVLQECAADLPNPCFKTTDLKKFTTVGAGPAYKVKFRRFLCFAFEIMG